MIQRKSRTTSSSEPELMDGRRESRPQTSDLVGDMTSSKFFFTLFNVFSLAVLGGLLGAGGVAYMARQFRNKPKDMKISVYLIHTRMYAQMTVVGTTINYFFGYDKESDKGYKWAKISEQFHRYHHILSCTAKKVNVGLKTILDTSVIYFDENLANKIFLIFKILSDL